MSQFTDESVGKDQSSTSATSRVPEAAQLEAQMENDRRNLAPRRQRLAETISLVGASPVEAQVAFLKSLMNTPAEAQAFMKDPKGYSVEHGMLLDPNLVRDISNSLLFEVNVDSGALARLGTRGAQEFLDMRSNHSVAAVPAAIAAGAAAVAAAAAVVEAVVTAVRAKNVQDLQALKGIGPRGITLPGGERFRS